MKDLPTSTDIYQVYFYTCPAHKPFHFARHPWIVTVSPVEVNRWEVVHRIHTSSIHYGYLHKNHYLCNNQGLEKTTFSKEHWSGILIGKITGNKNSLAERMVDFIETYSPDYLHKDTYHLYPGPNSNTYIQWILNKFPEANIQLPWNCFGKNYK